MDAEGVIQISFTDFTLFEDAPEFYSTFKLINEKNPGKVYSEKLRISNVNLTRIDLATYDDKEHKVDYWAKLFKAKSWEEVKMLAENRPEMEKAASSIWQLSEEDKIKEQIRRRTANEHLHQRRMEKLRRLEEEVREKDEELRAQGEELKAQSEELRGKDEELRAAQEMIEKREKRIRELEAMLSDSEKR